MDHTIQTGEWRKKQIVELCDFYNRLNIANTIKRKTLKWANHLCGENQELW